MADKKEDACEVGCSSDTKSAQGACDSNDLSHTGDNSCKDKNSSCKDASSKGEPASSCCSHDSNSNTNKQSCCCSSKASSDATASAGASSAGASSAGASLGCSTSDQASSQKSCCVCKKSSCIICRFFPFFLGLGLILFFGWNVFPSLLFKDEAQVFVFTHASHAGAADLSCSDCHSFSSDGRFVALPELSQCSSCHESLDSLMTADPTDAASQKARDAEIFFITNYVEQDKEVPWVAHQRQPDNVYFSHAAHFTSCINCHAEKELSLQFGSVDSPEKLCEQCHLPLAELDKRNSSAESVQVNRLTGYSSTTLSMGQCEACHALPAHYNNFGKGQTEANTACFTCHK